MKISHLLPLPSLTSRRLQLPRRKKLLISTMHAKIAPRTTKNSLLVVLACVVAPLAAITIITPKAATMTTSLMATMPVLTLATLAVLTASTRVLPVQMVISARLMATIVEATTIEATTMEATLARCTLATKWLTPKLKVAEVASAIKEMALLSVIFLAAWPTKDLTQVIAMRS